MVKFGFAVGSLALAALPMMEDIHTLGTGTVFLVGSVLFALGMWARQRLVQRGRNHGPLGTVSRADQADRPTNSTF